MQIEHTYKPGVVPPQNILEDLHSRGWKGIAVAALGVDGGVDICYPSVPVGKTREQATIELAREMAANTALYRSAIAIIR